MSSARDWAHSLASGLRRLERAPGRWFWLGVWLALFVASLWQYRSTLGGTLRDYDPSGGAWRDTSVAISMAREASPLHHFVHPFPLQPVFYRPGTAVWLWTVQRLLGDHPAAWRTCGLGMHAAVTTLFAMLVAAAARSRWPALLAAAWFAWRGEHYEVVTSIASQPDLPAAALALGAVLVLWRDRWRWGWRVAVSAVLGLMALLTKESAAGVLLFAAAAAPLWPVRDSAGKRVLAVAALAVAAAVYAVARTAALGGLLDRIHQIGLPPLVASLRVYPRMLWPPAHSLVLFWPSLQLGWIVLLSASFWLVLWQQIVYYGGAVLLFQRARRATLSLAAWLIIMPLPTLDRLIMFERYKHLPSMGWAGLAGLLLWEVGLIWAQRAREYSARREAQAQLPTPATPPARTRASDRAPIPSR